MLRVLLAKDLRRARRNPVAYLIHLAMPLVITALLGFVFGRGGGTGGDSVGKIRFAVVDEDDTVLTSFLRGAVNQGQGGERLQAVFLDRTNALAQVTDNQISAVLIIPPGFTRDYLSGSNRVTLELVKNPAQSFHPAILEELLGALTTGLNALARNFRSQLIAWNDLVTRPGGPNYGDVSDQIRRSGEQFEAVKDFLNPPRVSYVKETQAGERSTGPGFNLFAFLLPGLAAMFLLFLAEVSVRDFFYEVRVRTFERYCTLPQSIFGFVTAKVVFSLAVVLIGAAIILGGGGALFRIHWERPLPMIVVILSYALFSVGLLTLLAAFAQNERRADAVGNVIAMGLGLAGGCAFPSEALPAFLRLHITPWMPPNWFVEAVRGLQSGTDTVWMLTALKLVLLGALFTALAAWLLDRRLRKGVRV